MLNAVITISFLHYCMPFQLTVNIPAGIHNTDYRYNTRILIRNIKHQIIVNGHYPHSSAVSRLFFIMSELLLKFFKPHNVFL